MQQNDIKMLNELFEKYKNTILILIEKLSNLNECEFFSDEHSNIENGKITDKIGLKHKFNFVYSTRDENSLFYSISKLLFNSIENYYLIKISLAYIVLNNADFFRKNIFMGSSNDCYDFVIKIITNQEPIDEKVLFCLSFLLKRSIFCYTLNKITDKAEFFEYKTKNYSFACALNIANINNQYYSLFKKV
jgi:hypothetical protein